LLCTFISSNLERKYRDSDFRESRLLLLISRIRRFGNNENVAEDRVDKRQACRFRKMRDGGPVRKSLWNLVHCFGDRGFVTSCCHGTNLEELIIAGCWIDSQP
jgi:hypothetical protein